MPFIWVLYCIYALCRYSNVCSGGIKEQYALPCLFKHIHMILLQPCAVTVNDIKLYNIDISISLRTTTNGEIIPVLLHYYSILQYFTLSQYFAVFYNITVSYTVVEYSSIVQNRRSLNCTLASSSASPYNQEI